MHKRTRLFPLVLFAFAALSTSPGFAEPKKYPKAIYEPTEYNFGEILSGEVLDREIKITNDGEADLLVKQIDFTCGCSIPKILLSTGAEVIPKLEGEGEYVTLEPGQWAVVKLEFQSLGREGGVRHRMDIQTNDPREQIKRIPIRAKVKRAVLLDPQILDFGMIDKNGTVSLTVRVEANGIGDFTITGIKEMPDYLDYSVARAETKEGENPAYLLTVSYNGGASIGKQKHSLKVMLDHPKVSHFALFTEMRVFPAVIFRCGEQRVYEFMDLGLIEAGTEKQVELEIINSDLKQPYVVTGIRCNSNSEPAITARLVTDKPGMNYRIVITVPAQTKKRFIGAKLLIFSEHPDLPSARILLKGLFK
ncbi:MAG: DUF1573 domain-containing protein [Planctomycetota bacterium]